MKKNLISCFIVAATIGLQAQNMKPQKMIEYRWNESANKWDEEFTFKMKYDNAGNLIYKNTFDHLANNPLSEDSIIYNGSSNALSKITSKWYTAQNKFVFDSRVDNCFDNQQRDCGVSDYNWNGNSWSFSGGYQKTYGVNNVNNSATKMLRVWSDAAQAFEAQESVETYFNPNGSKSIVVQYLRDSNTGFLVPRSKNVYGGWHNEAAGIFTSSEAYERNGNTWVIASKVVIEDSISYWKYVALDSTQNTIEVSKKAKNNAFQEDYRMSSGSALLSHTYYQTGLTDTETWFYYDANNVLQSQEKVVTVRNLNNDITSTNTTIWTPSTGWTKDSENIFHITYDASGNTLEIIAIDLDIGTSVYQNNYRLVFDGYIQVGNPANTCGISPTISGDLMICPDDLTTLSTQQFGSYQWYTRPFGSSSAPTLAVGDTNQTFSVSHSMGAVYVSVKVYDDTCTETSPEVLVDGYAFLPVTVSSSGNFSVSPNGEQLICPGEAITMVLNLPYVTNITWFNGNDIISNAFNEDTLLVTEPGEYWVVASPAECPNWANGLGTPISVLVLDAEECNTDVGDISYIEAKIYPNPATSFVNIELPYTGVSEIILFDVTGRELFKRKFETVAQIDVSGLARGIYLVDVANDKGKARAKLQLN